MRMRQLLLLMERALAVIGERASVLIWVTRSGCPAFEKVLV